MRIGLFAVLAFAAVTIFTNVAAAGNIAHGVKVVIVDAGHGGKFPGAHYGGVYEKDLTLKVALKLGKLVEEGMPGVRVVYTRKTDTELGATLADDLQARADTANRNGGDLFISIHVNAARSTAARGVETLIMGESSKEQRYNESALYENNREDLIDMSDERTAAIVRAYIQNLQFTYGEFSMAIARCIQNNYTRSGRHSRGIKPQLLRVLYATDMPGVLTEIGFMSNSEEMAYMKSEKGQNEIARSLFNAVKDYSAFVRGTQLMDEQDAVAGDALPATESVQTKSDPVKPVEKSEQRSKNVVDKKRELPVRYAVQILASTKIVSLSSSQFRSYKGKVKQYSSSGKFRYKYCVGEFRDKESAQKKLREVHKVFPDAFVVRCQGTEIVK